MKPLSATAKKSPSITSTSRRQFIQGALVVGAVSLLGSKQSQAEDTNFNGRASAPKAYSLAQQNVIELVDIRRPSEWRATGVGKGAHKISMHQNGFVGRIDKLLGGDRSKPVALICAHGNRSGRMKARLNELGFTNVINVSEGMLGSQSGAGWLKRKLPVK